MAGPCVRGGGLGIIAFAACCAPGVRIGRYPWGLCSLGWHYKAPGEGTGANSGHGGGGGGGAESGSQLGTPSPMFRLTNAAVRTHGPMGVEQGCP